MHQIDLARGHLMKHVQHLYLIGQAITNRILHEPQDKMLFVLDQHKEDRSLNPVVDHSRQRLIIPLPNESLLVFRL